jgi:hypothetical protein
MYALAYTRISRGGSHSPARVADADSDETRHSYGQQHLRVECPSLARVQPRQLALAEQWPEGEVDCWRRSLARAGHAHVLTGRCEEIIIA